MSAPGAGPCDGAARCAGLPALALILGGARSGKSGFALRLARSLAGQPARDVDDGMCCYIATARAGDAEMAERIKAHQCERGADWQTLEAPLDLAGALAAQRAVARVILIDCVTLWLSNIMAAGRDPAREVAHLARALCSMTGAQAGSGAGRARALRRAAPVILVSNEVGMGLVPATPVGRAFRDVQGRANQQLAACCDTVIFVAAGLPLILKPAGSSRDITRAVASLADTDDTRRTM